MKKLFSVLLISLLLSASPGLLAQDEGKKDDKVGGLRLGYHTSAMYMDGEIYPGTEQLPTMYIGFFRDNPLVSILSIHSGLEYFQNGFRVDENNKRALHYLSVPIGLKAKIGPAFALSGFAPSFKVAEREFVDGEKTTPDDKSEWFDVPFFIGAGVKIAFLTIDARYHWGLLEVREGYNSRYFQIGAGFSF